MKFCAATLTSLLLVLSIVRAQESGGWSDAKDYKGEHFTVRSDADEKAAKQTLAWAEDVLAAFLEEFKGHLEFTPPADGMTIYFFKNRKGLDEHNKTAHGDRAGLKQAPGFFSNEDKIGHFTPDIPRDAQNTLEEIVKHETTHQIAYYAFASKGDPTGRPHFWAWEGLATYFETTQRKGKKLVTGNPGALWMKKGRELVKKKDHDAWKDYVEYDQRKMRGHYPQAAVMTHFFMNVRRGELRPKFLEYARIVHEGTAEADTFEKVFGAKPETLEPGWAEYVRTLK